MPASKKRNRPPQPDTERKKTQRRLNREHLLSQGFDGDPEKLVTRWRRGEIRVTFEIVEKEGYEHENLQSKE